MDAICTLCPGSQKQVITEIEGWVSPPTTATRTEEPPPTPFRYTLHPLPKCWLRPASEENTLRPLVRGQRPRIGQEEDVETIVSFSAVL